MSTILYGNFSIEIQSGTGARVDRLTWCIQPTLTPRFTDVGQNGSPWLAGRQQELAFLRAAVRARRPVQLFATCGYGKTTLLRHVMDNAAREGLADRGVYLRAGPGGLEDLLHRLVSELYTAERPVKLAPDECAQLLRRVQALVVLDDVAFGPAQLGRLLTTLPGCSLLLGSPRATADPQTASRALPGLGNDAARQMIARHLGRALTGDELTAAARLTLAVRGQPLHLKQAAALAAEGRVTLAELARMAESDPGYLDEVSINALAPRYRRALAVLALAAGALLPMDLVSAMGGIAEIHECLGLLHRRGLAETHHDRFGLPVCKTERYRELLLTDLHHAAAVRELANWLACRNPTAPDSIEAASAALAVTEWAGDGEDWAGVLRLVRVAGPVLTLAGRWEAARHLFGRGLRAAKAAASSAGEALFSHELGTLALCLDELGPARELLGRALEFRERGGDHAGAAVTRHNLGVLAPPPAPPSAPPPARPPAPRRRPEVPWRKISAVAGGLLAVLGLTVGVVKAITPSPRPVTITTHRAPTLPPESTGRRTVKSKGPNGHGSTGTQVSQDPSLNGVTPPPGGGPAGGKPSGPQPPALKPPVLRSAPFSPVDITTPSAATQAVTVRNPNSQPLRTTQAATAAPFSVAADGCAASPVPAGGTCTITVRFAPTAVGDDGEPLTVGSAAGPATIQLTGAGYVELTVDVGGDGTGTITGAPGPGCSTACQVRVTGPVSLTASPDPGDFLASWGPDDCATTGPAAACEVPLTADSTVEPTFGLDKVPVP